MPNLLTRTEQFDHADWTQADSIVVTANTNPAPGFAGRDAGLADTLADETGVTVSQLHQEKTVASDTTLYVASLYIRKHPDVGRFPALFLEFRGGVTATGAVQLNTATGAIADFPGLAPASSGVVNVDPEWWRLWLTFANTAGGNTTLRFGIWPAVAAGLGGGFDSPTQGRIVVWGANVFAAAAVAAYEAEPLYAIVPVLPMATRVGVQRVR